MRIVTFSFCRDSAGLGLGDGGSGLCVTCVPIYSKWFDSGSSWSLDLKKDRRICRTNRSADEWSWDKPPKWWSSLQHTGRGLDLAWDKASLVTFCFFYYINASLQKKSKLTQIPIFQWEDTCMYVYQYIASPPLQGWMWQFDTCMQCTMFKSWLSIFPAPQILAIY